MRIPLLCILLLLSSIPANALSEEIPIEMRGLWVAKKSFCDSLKSRGPGSLRQGEDWLKITATDVLGSTQGRFFRVLSISSMSVPSTRLSVAVQAFGGDDLMHELALLRNGELIERIVDARGVATYQKC